MADNCKVSREIIATVSARTSAGKGSQNPPELRKFTLVQDKCNEPSYPVEIYDNGVYKAQGSQPNESTLVGTWNFPKDDNGEFTISPNNKFSSAYIKDISDKKNQLAVRALSYRIETLGPIAEANGQKIRGVPQQKTLDQALAENVLAKNQIEYVMYEGVPNSKDFKEWPASLDKLYYPENIMEIKQDYIKFTILEYKTRIFNIDTFARSKRFTDLKSINAQTGEKQDVNKIKLVKSVISMPIQSGITDNNTVTWNADPLDAVRQAAQFNSLSLQTTSNILELIPSQLDTAKKLVADPKVSQSFQMAIGSLLARMAINSENNFFSRAFGAILNPNLELLFQNPELRQFTLRFDLTPRNYKEAKIVRQIIRAFKQSMAAKLGAADMFLKTPMVYDIEYINNSKGNNKLHKGINRIKTCALRNLSVNYTPSNQYMTYEGGEQEMTAYTLDMQFTELEPIYYDDYSNLPTEDEIGY